MMRPLIAAAVLFAAAPILAPAGALAGPWEDGMAAYVRGDYVPAVQLFRPLAQQGNAKAQGVLGTMYRKGQGVAKSRAHAVMWLSLASARGNALAKAELHDMSRSMSPEELAHAREMMRSCEVSNYRSCAY
jgi:TPR repeat protein